MKPLIAVQSIEHSGLFFSLFQLDIFYRWNYSCLCHHIRTKTIPSAFHYLPVRTVTSTVKLLCALLFTNMWPSPGTIISVFRRFSRTWMLFIECRFDSKSFLMPTFRYESVVKFWDAQPSYNRLVRFPKKQKRLFRRWAVFVECRFYSKFTILRHIIDNLDTIDRHPSLTISRSSTFLTKFIVLQ